MTRLLIAAALWAASFAVPAATYYVRTDGNSACNGTQNVAYSSGVTNCAKATPAQGIALLASGDTLIIRNGSYSVTSNLSVPASNTRILGEQHAACRVKPELWGANGRRSNLLSIIGRSNVEVACLEITDHNACVGGHPTLDCDTGDDYVDNGVYLYNNSSIVLRDLNIHGVTRGLVAGKVNNLTLERVRLHANARAGFEGNTSNSDDSFTGTVLLKNVEMSWNGCSEQYPLLKIYACLGDLNGGYGDGLGTVDTEGTWIIEDSYVHHNTSDGLDLRYTRLNTPSTSVTIRRSWFYNNAGNQVKAWGYTTIENSFISSYCSYFGSRYGSPNIQSCRADGTAIFIIAPNISGVGVTIRYSTITGNSLLMFHYHQEAGAGAASIARLENNVFIGQSAWNGSGLSYFTNDGNSTIQYYNNHVYNMRGGTCPTGSACTNPLLRNQSGAAFDPRPQAGSPVLGAGNRTYTTPATDILGRPRPAAPARGAFEYSP